MTSPTQTVSGKRRFKPVHILGFAGGKDEELTQTKKGLTLLSLQRVLLQKVQGVAKATYKSKLS